MLRDLAEQRTRRVNTQESLVAEAGLRAHGNGFNDDAAGRAELNDLARFAHNLAAVLTDFIDALGHILDLDAEVIDHRFCAVAIRILFSGTGLIDGDMNRPIR